jgi:hypothetical protein
MKNGDTLLNPLSDLMLRDNSQFGEEITAHRRPKMENL